MCLVVLLWCNCSEGQRTLSGFYLNGIHMQLQTHTRTYVHAYVNVEKFWCHFELLCRCIYYGFVILQSGSVSLPISAWLTVYMCVQQSLCHIKDEQKVEKSCKNKGVNYLVVRERCISMYIYMYISTYICLYEISMCIGVVVLLYTISSYNFVKVVVVSCSCTHKI